MKFKELSESIKTATTCHQSDGLFSLALTAAFSKSVGFVQEQQREGPQTSSFWLAPTLRGICEDLIVLGHIDRNLPKESLNNWSRRAADERDSVGFLN